MSKLKARKSEHTIKPEETACNVKFIVLYLFTSVVVHISDKWIILLINLIGSKRIYVILSPPKKELYWNRSRLQKVYGTMHVIVLWTDSEDILAMQHECVQNNSNK